MPRVTVAVPARNAERFLGEALDSISRQTVRDHEVVVCDDGSTDGTAEIARARGATVVHGTGEGPAAARNRAIRAGTGELVALLDADDVWLEPKLERQLAALEAAPSSLVVTCAAATLGARDRPARLAEGRVTAALVEQNFVTTSSVLLRRAAFERAGGFDTDPALVAVEDYAMWLALSLDGPFAAVEERLVGRRIHDANLSRDSIELARRTILVLERFARRAEAAPHARALAERQAALHYVVGRGCLGRGQRREGREALRRSRALSTTFAARASAFELMSWLPRTWLVRMRSAKARGRVAHVS